MTIILDEGGLAIWHHKHIENLFAIRMYEWVDRVTFLFEQETRKVVGTANFSSWAGKDMFDEWVSVYPVEYKKVKKHLKEMNLWKKSSVKNAKKKV
jgi:hypothetical protein